jgi:hypothetical protein
MQFRGHSDWQRLEHVVSIPEGSAVCGRHFVAGMQTDYGHLEKADAVVGTSNVGQPFQAEIFRRTSGWKA